MYSDHLVLHTQSRVGSRVITLQDRKLEEPTRFETEFCRSLICDSRADNRNCLQALCLLNNLPDLCSLLGL